MTFNTAILLSVRYTFYVIIFFTLHKRRGETFNYFCMLIILCRKWKQSFKIAIFILRLNLNFFKHSHCWQAKKNKRNILHYFLKRNGVSLIKCTKLGGIHSDGSRYFVTRKMLPSLNFCFHRMFLKFLQKIDLKIRKFISKVQRKICEKLNTESGKCLIWI